mmetsp:Transcript_28026/g.45603  ORF Transcript_28026/g.45603 Transcript_28026/m.45603 type:complete len:132 (+) Transcript_28026:77-472(+)
MSLLALANFYLSVRPELRRKYFINTFWRGGIVFSSSSSSSSSSSPNQILLPVEKHCSYSSATGGRRVVFPPTSSPSFFPGFDPMAYSIWFAEYVHGRGEVLDQVAARSKIQDFLQRMSPTSKQHHHHHHLE